MDFDPDLIATMPYTPQGLLIDELLSVDAEAGELRARMLAGPRPLPFLAEQRNHAVIHPPHVPAGVLVHLTGMMGLLHAWYVMELRFTDGWIGYGTRIHRADFKRLVSVDEPLELRVTETARRGRGPRRIVRYDFVFEQGGAACYVGDQTAMWRRLEADGPRWTG